MTDVQVVTATGGGDGDDRGGGDDGRKGPGKLSHAFSDILGLRYESDAQVIIIFG